MTDLWLFGARLLDGTGPDPVGGRERQDRGRPGKTPREGAGGRRGGRPDRGRIGLLTSIEDRALLVRHGQIEGFKAGRAADIQVGLRPDLIGLDRTGGLGDGDLRRARDPDGRARRGTSTHAEILRIADRTGTLEDAKLADLVAWRTDPLEYPKVFIERHRAALVLTAGVVVKDAR